MLTLYMSIANGVSWEQVLVPLHAASCPDRTTNPEAQMRTGLTGPIKP